MARLDALWRDLAIRHTAILSAAATLALTCGCQVLSYTSPQGEKFTRSSLGANTTISSLGIESDTNGVRRVQMQGYQNETTQALSVVTEAAVKAALQSVK
jgi:hypothetical protein